MNIVACGENCRYQVDGCCTRSDLSVNAQIPSAKCCYFEQRTMAVDN